MLSASVQHKCRLRCLKIFLSQAGKRLRHPEAMTFCVQVTVSNGVVRHDDKAAADWSSSAAQLTRQFLVKNVSHFRSCITAQSAVTHWTVHALVPGSKSVLYTTRAGCYSMTAVLQVNAHLAFPC